MILNKLPLVFLSRAGTAFLSFMVMLYLMKCLSLEQFADYSLYFTIFTMCAVIPNMGVNNYIVLENKNKENFIKIKNVRLYFICAILLILLILYESNLVSSKLLLFSISAGFLSSIFDLNMSLQQAHKNMFKYSLYMPLKTLLMTLVAVYTIYVYKKIFVDAYFRNLFIVFFIFFIFWFILNVSKSMKNISDNLRIYNLGFNLFFYEVLALILVRCEIFILNYYDFIISKTDIAKFWAAYNFVLILSIVSSTLSNMILPYLKDRNEKEIDEVVSRVSKYMLVIVLVVSVASYIVGDYFIKNYSGIYVSVLMMGFGIYFSFFANINRLKILSGIGSNRLANTILVFQLLLTIVLNLIFIYWLGVFGAVLTFLIVRYFGHYFLKQEVSKNSF